MCKLLFPEFKSQKSINNAFILQFLNLTGHLNLIQYFKYLNKNKYKINSNQNKIWRPTRRILDFLRTKYDQQKISFL